ncbi:MAG: hypothetical protein H7239_13725 [Flavobacterium sp.]|nr:hypothetical protein [Flavobacterium sp.]
MKLYNYLLFRIFNYYRNDYKESDGLSKYSTVLVSTLILYFILLVLILYIDFYFFKILDYILPNKISVLLCLIFIGLLNYYFFIKDKKFLNYDFKNGKKGGYIIIFFIVLLALIFVFIANKNRDKIFKEREKLLIEHKQ